MTGVTTVVSFQANGTFDALGRLRELVDLWDELGPRVWAFFQNGSQVDALRVSTQGRRARRRLGCCPSRGEQHRQGRPLSHVLSSVCGCGKSLGISAGSLSCRQRGLWVDSRLPLPLRPPAPPYFLDIPPVLLQRASRRRCPGIHYPGPNLYTNEPAILFCLHFPPAPLARFPPLAADTPVCHLPRSFKVAGAFYVDEAITVSAGAAVVMEDKASGPGEKDVPQEHAFRAIEARGFRPVLIPRQLPWQPGGQFGVRP